MPGAGVRSGFVVPDTMTGIMDTETERNRLLARSGYPSSSTSAFNQPQSHGYTGDWAQSDSSTPARGRILSAQRYHKESGKLVVLKTFS